MKKKIVTTGIVASATIIAAYMQGENVVEQKVDNQISQSVNIENIGYEKAIDYILNSNEELKNDNQKLKNDNQKLKNNNEELKLNIEELKQEHTTNLDKSIDKKEKNNNFEENSSLISLIECSRKEKVIYDGSSYTVYPSKEGTNGSINFTIAGKKYNDGFILRCNGYVLLSLDKKFSGISFDVGRIDSMNPRDAEIFIEADSTQIAEFSVKYDEGLNKKSEEGIIDTKGVNILKIYQETNDVSAAYGYTNFVLYY